MNAKYKQMWGNLKDPEFRKQFIDAHVDEGIAFQIRSLRNKKELTQPKLAQELGVKQPLVSAWENPAYGKYSLNTLKKLAKIFDVGLLVRFVPFSTLVNWTVDLTPEIIAPASFNEEEQSLNTRRSLERIIAEMDTNRANQFAGGIAPFAAGGPTPEITISASTTISGEELAYVA